ncbi:hypothetical protein [Nostoc sp. JL33]|nr:hypothetical protein [Nostoc sp. JL33]MBN3871664.1 hypothetical protein [Nostoc sp. JL33]
MERGQSVLHPTENRRERFSTRRSAIARNDCKYFCPITYIPQVLSQPYLY